MSGWLRHFALSAQVRTGFSGGVLVWAIIAAVASMVAVIFLLIAAFIALADRYDPLIAGLVLGGCFVLIALIALAVCLIVRSRNMRRARLELAARESNTSWLDPKLLAVGFQIAQTVGWRRIVTLAAVGIVAAGLAKEWSARDKPPASDDEPPADS